MIPEFSLNHTGFSIVMIPDDSGRRKASCAAATFADDAKGLCHINKINHHSVAPPAIPRIVTTDAAALLPTIPEYYDHPFRFIVTS